MVELTYHILMYIGLVIICVSSLILAVKMLEDGAIYEDEKRSYKCKKQ